MGEKVVPRVFLHATGESALTGEDGGDGKDGGKGVTLDLLKRWAAEGEAKGGGGSLEGNVAVEPTGGKGGMVRETH